MNFAVLGSVPQALATVIAATVAWRVSQNWRRQEVGKRRQAVAEEALTTVYQVVAAIDHVRHPMVWAGEMVREDVQLTGNEGTYYAIQKRIQQHKDTFAALNRAVLITEVHFGNHAAQQIREFYSFINRVISANDILGSMDQRSEPELRRNLECERQSRPGNDQLGDQMKAATERVRATLIPHMRMPGEIDPDAPPPRRIAALSRFLKFRR
nr:hypothetical protein [uncultured Rhodopila sp.]